MRRRFHARDAGVLLAALLAVAATSAVHGGRLPDVSATTVALALLLVVLATATLGVWIAIVVASWRCSRSTSSSAAGRHVHDRRSAELDRAARLPDRRGDRQQPLGRGPGARAGRHRAPQRGDAAVRSHPRVLLTTETAGAIDALARHVARRFELTGVAICLPADHGWNVHQAEPRKSTSSPC